MRDANLLEGRHPPAMRGFAGRRSSHGETARGTKTQIRRSRQTIDMDQEEVPEMWNRIACAAESMPLWSCLYLNSVVPGSRHPKRYCAAVRCGKAPVLIYGNSRSLRKAAFALAGVSATGIVRRTWRKNPVLLDKYVAIVHPQ